MTTICPNTGHLRSWLDGEAAPAENGLAQNPTDLAEHLADCDACQTTLGGLQRDADLVHQTLAAGLTAPPSVDETERALASMHRQLTIATAVPALTPSAMTQGAMNHAPAHADPVAARIIAPENDAPVLTPALSTPKRAPRPR